MVNNRDDKNDVGEDIEITNEPTSETEREFLDEEEMSVQAIKKMKIALKECENEKRKVLDDLQRTKADFLNARKRLEQQQLVAAQRASIQFIESLLPLCDSFDQAMSHTEVWERADEQWRKGIEGIHAQLQGLLKQYQVEAFSPIGEMFDPTEHEALSEEPVTDEQAAGKIVRVIQAGYRLSNEAKTLVRPARVVVGSKES